MGLLPPQHWVRKAENHTHREPFFIFCNEIWEDHLQSVSFSGGEGATLYVPSDFPQKENLDEAGPWHPPSSPFTPPPPETPPEEHKVQPADLGRLPFSVDPISTLFLGGAPQLTPSLTRWGSVKPLVSASRAQRTFKGGSVTPPPPNTSHRPWPCLAHRCPHLLHFLFASLPGLEEL